MEADERLRSGTWVCPVCQEQATVAPKQVERRFSPEGIPFVFRRGRRCLSCGAVWNTYECIEVGSVIDGEGKVVL